MRPDAKRGGTFANGLALDLLAGDEIIDPHEACWLRGAHAPHAIGKPPSLPLHELIEQGLDMRFGDGADRRMIADYKDRAVCRAGDRACRGQYLRPQLGRERRFVDKIDNGEGLLVLRHIQHRHLPGRSNGIHLHGSTHHSAAETFAARRLRIAYGIAAPVLQRDGPAARLAGKARSTVAAGRLPAWFLIALPDCEFGPG
ncbi:hypothetical protein MES4922_110380 [Mesorhizobium ventifaucium]|uniref:Uncharacterized protein n=1 Tax=Mesorhizobium ventifaucium TaxID=666020 RepID=A0ABN8JC05_9HYPH|nr:hypothetical protein MES4922_110380 [Mesorhizobium ventifaucium]